MSEKHKNSPETTRPNYARRRGVAALIAAGAVIIPVSGNTDKAVSVPVDIAKGTAELVREANEPKGREIPNHTVRIENANGIKGGVFFGQQGNSENHLGSGPEG